ncbi:MAG: hypothetical protein E3K38_04745 [Candidatus Kuenenia stuttgartiensis]|nr:hypothetical protein [Candidatus Kuenenia stuttgartiensis]
MHNISADSLVNLLSFDYKGVDIRLKSLSIGEMYDDNVRFEKENKIDDLITIAGIEAVAKYEGKRRMFEIGADVSSQTFAHHDVYDNITQEVTTRFRNEFSKYDSVSLTNHFSHSDAPLFNRKKDFFLEQFGRTGGRFDYYQNRFDIEYLREVTRRLAVSFRYDNDIDVFTGVDMENSFYHSAGARANYMLTSDTGLLLSGNYAGRWFEDGGNASIYTITTGIRQTITNKIYFDGKIGVNVVDSFDNEDFSKLLADAALFYRTDSDLLGRLSFTKKTDTNPYVEDVFNNWRISASLAHQFLKRLGSSVSVFYGRGEFDASGSEQRFTGLNTTVLYDISKRLTGTFTYTYSDADSNINTADYTKNTAFFGIKAEF